MSSPPVYATFFFVDIVGLSDPVISMTAQANKIRLLNSIISESEAFEKNQSGRYVLPTGDGMAIGFFNQHPKIALDLAMSIHKKLNEYNKGKDLKMMVAVRIGINYGQVTMVKDLNDSDNYWGSGIIMGRRIMDLGKDMHILTTERVAEELTEFSEEMLEIVHPVGEYSIKHGRKVQVYSIYGEGFGNADPPIREDGSAEVTKIEQKALLELDSTNPALLHIQNYLEELNTTGAPQLYSTEWAIASNKESANLEDVMLQAWDKEGKLEYVIDRDEPHVKVFRFGFRRVLNPGERTCYWWKYDVTKTNPSWTTVIPKGVHRFELLFKYPRDMNLVPVLRDVCKPSEAPPIKFAEKEESDKFSTVTWSKWAPSVETVRLTWKQVPDQKLIS